MMLWILPLLFGFRRLLFYTSIRLLVARVFFFFRRSLLGSVRLSTLNLDLELFTTVDPHDPKTLT